MKRFILSILVLALALGASAKNYLISSEATTDSAKISYKGAEYVVGVDAFASIAALMNVFNIICRNLRIPMGFAKNGRIYEKALQNFSFFLL